MSGCNAEFSAKMQRKQPRITFTYHWTKNEDFH